MDLLFDGNALLNVVTNAVVYNIRNNSNFDMSYITVGDKMILKDSSKQFFRNFINPGAFRDIHVLSPSPCNIGVSVAWK